VDKNHKINKVRGDTLEVKLLDSSFTPYFKSSAHTSSNKEMEKLLQELKEKGVTFPSNWF